MKDPDSFQKVFEQKRKTLDNVDTIIDDAPDRQAVSNLLSKIRLMRDEAWTPINEEEK